MNGYKPGLLLNAWLVALLAGASVGCAPDPHPFAESVRFGTFNVQFLPWIAETQPARDDVERPVRIANRIKDSGYDVIVLNEVFDEDARNAFVTALFGTYPYYVSYIGDDAVGSEDSGLMLFSRLPFVDLPNDSHLADPDNVRARSNGADFKQVAYREFEAHSFGDGLAAKGVALVRVRNTATQRVYNIAFTHMEASYPADEITLSAWQIPQDIREDQIAEIREVMVDTLGPFFTREETFLLGDLNIDGNLTAPTPGPFECCKPNRFEWEQRMNTPGTFLTDQLVDAWAFEQSPDDPGLTSLVHWGQEVDAGRGARLDYILRNRTIQPPEDQLCAQHLSLAHNLRDTAPFTPSAMGTAGIDPLSDHIGLNIDLNQAAPHCSPLEPVFNPPVDEMLPGTVTWPGSVQWTRIDTPGTYDIGVATDGFAFEVYASDDMSTPLRAWFGQSQTSNSEDDRPVQTERFHISDPPFFIKTFATDRKATGDYEYLVHKATCTSVAEACTLMPAVAVQPQLPSTPPNPDDAFFYELRPEAPTVPGPVELTVRVGNLFDPGAELELQDANGTVIAGPVVGGQAGSSNNDVQLSTAYTGTGPLYAVLRRGAPTSIIPEVFYTTNLTVFHGGAVGVPGSVWMGLTCYEETDTIGIDEIVVDVIVDGVNAIPNNTVGDFDDGRYDSLEDNIPTLRFTESMTLRVIDLDDGANGDNDIMTLSISPLDPLVPHDLRRDDVVSCCGGTYQVDFNLSHGLPIAVP